MALPDPLPADPSQNSVHRGGAAIVAIVCHDTGGTNSLSTLQTGDGRGVSIHVLIRRDGNYYRLLPDIRGANHAGSATAVLRLNGKTYRSGEINRVTLGVELEHRHEKDYPDAQMLTFGRVVAQWWRLWGPLPIVRHGDIDPTRRSDPRGLTVAMLEEWVRRAERADDPTAPLPGTPPPGYKGRWRLRVQAWVRRTPSTKGIYVGLLSVGQEIDGELRMGEVHRGIEDWVAFQYQGHEAFVWSGQTERIK